MFDRFGCKVKHIKIHALGGFAIGKKINAILKPHGFDFLIESINKLFGFLSFEIIGPDIITHTTPVSLPSAELAEDSVVNNFGTIRRIGSKASAGKWQLFMQPAIGIHSVKLAQKIIEGCHARTKENILAIGCPTEGDIVWAHTIRNFIPAKGGSPSQSLGFTA